MQRPKVWYELQQDLRNPQLTDLDREALCSRVSKAMEDWYHNCTMHWAHVRIAASRSNLLSTRAWLNENVDPNHFDFFLVEPGVWQVHFKHRNDAMLFKLIHGGQ